MIDEITQKLLTVSKREYSQKNGFGYYRYINGSELPNLPGTYEVKTLKITPLHLQHVRFRHFLHLFVRKNRRIFALCSLLLRSPFALCSLFVRSKAGKTAADSAG